VEQLSIIYKYLKLLYLYQKTASPVRFFLFEASGWSGSRRPGFLDKHNP